MLSKKHVLTRFRLFLEVDRQLTDTTVYHHLRRLKIFLQHKTDISQVKGV
jgi:hypothetical protein